MIDVAVFGYLSIDCITCPAGRFEDVPGGAAYYCAAAAAAAGASVVLVAQAGADYPEQALAALATLGVTLEVTRAPGPAPRAHILEPSAAARSTPHHRDPAWWDAQRRLQPPCSPTRSAVTVCMAMPGESLAQQIDDRARHSTLLVDTGTSYAAAERDLLLKLLPRIDVFAPSREETRLLHPGLDDDAALAALAGVTPVVIQKRGADGLFLARSGHATRHAPAQATAVVDPTGAGDSVVGAVAAALARGMDDAALLASANRIAARCISGVGIGGLLPADERETGIARAACP